MPIVARKATPVLGGRPEVRGMAWSPRGVGVGGFVRSVLEAPGTELGPAPMAIPGMVFQKAGVPAIRRLIGKQTAQYLEGPTYPKGASPFWGTVPEEVKAARRATPIIDRNLQKVAEAETGRPTTLVGFRAQAKGGPVPGRGVHYSAVPEGAKPFVPGEVTSKAVSKSTSVIKLKNPFVQYHGNQEMLVRKLMQRPEQLSPKLRRIGEKLDRTREQQIGSLTKGIEEKWYTKADKWLTRVMKERGHDGIIYSGRREIVDFGGTVTKRGTKRVSQSRGAR